MTPDDVISEVKQDASEWAEMSVDPAMFIARVLATRIIKLQNHIEYLEKRLKHDSSITNSSGTYTRKS